MWKFRISFGLVLLGLAGVVVLSALDVGDDGLIAWLALWATAASLAWKGFRAFLGRIEPQQTQTAPQPAPPAQPGVPLTPTDSSWSQDSPEALPSPVISPDNRSLDTDTPPPAVRTGYREVIRAVGEAIKGTALFASRVTVVLVLLLLVPMTLGLFIGGIVLLCKGNVPKAGLAFLAAGWLGWYCCGPLRELWNGDGDENPQTSRDETGAGAEVEGGYEGRDGAVSDSTVPMSAPPQLSLPEEFLLLSYHRYGDVHDREQTAVGCAAAELGELALRRRLRVTPRKSKVFGFEFYSLSGKIQVLDLAPTGLAWADDLLAELERLAASRRRHTASGVAPTGSQRKPIRLHKWLRLRGHDALLLHTKALTERSVLFHSPGFRPGDEERHYPDVAVRNALISRLWAVTNERVPMDEHMLLLLELVGSARLNQDLGLTLSMRQRLDRARGIGAVAALPEDMRDTSTVLSMSIPSRNRGGVGGGSGGGDGGV